MSKLLLIEHAEGRREIALMAGRRLLAYCQDREAGVEAEQIYLAAADRMARGMEACFVRLGGSQTGFLPFSECRALPRSGDRLILQVKKPPLGDKAPYLTEDISLAGRFLILTPKTERCAVSKRIAEEDERRRLLALARRLQKDGMGLVMRLESRDASEEALARERDDLLARWAEIAARAAAASGPCLLAGRPDALARLIRDEHGGIDRILTDDPAALPPLPVPAESCHRPFELYGVREALEKSLRRKVWLDCGGYLVIDRTEALTVIDVNSGKYTGGKAGAESTFLKLNLEAAAETARLLRLRNLGGIVIVDFVDMQREENRAAVLAALEAALADDPVKTVIHGFTALGLMELTRKKAEESL